jgi:hypothetical protein
MNMMITLGGETSFEDPPIGRIFFHDIMAIKNKIAAGIKKEIIIFIIQILQMTHER